MKNFELTPDMLTMGGTFYPKGYMFVMYASLDDASRIAHAIDATPDGAGTVMLLSSSNVIRDVGKADDTSDVVLQSVGTEGATVRKYVSLARQGHCAVMVKTDSDLQTERLMHFLRTVPFSYGQRYHLLAIEDLESSVL